MKAAIIFFSLLCALHLTGWGQPVTYNGAQFETSTKLKAVFSDRWNASVSTLTRNYLEQFRFHHLFLPTVDVGYKKSEQLAFHLGGASIDIASPEEPNAPINYRWNEYRIHQSIVFAPPSLSNRWKMRFMLEERWLQNATNNVLENTHRFTTRYRFKKTLKESLYEGDNLNCAIVAGGEFFFSSATSRALFFDQTRFDAGISLKFWDSTHLNLSYQHWYQSFPSASISRDILRIHLSHTLDFTS